MVKFKKFNNNNKIKSPSNQMLKNKQLKAHKL